MKKSIIALAVAGALTAPMVAQADATLYGSLRLSLTDDTGTSLSLNDNVSRIGLKGSSELFSGNKAIYQFEQSVTAHDNTGWNGGRLAIIGVQGDFGTAQAGQMWTPHYLWTATATDILDNDASGLDAGHTRIGQTLAYISPNMSGFNVAAAVQADGGTDESIDLYHVAAKYSMDGLTVAGSYVYTTGPEEDTTALAISYAADAFYIGARIQDDEINHGNNGNEWSVAASYSVENTKFLASYTDEDSAAEESYSLEVQQKLGKQARVFAAYRDLRGNEGVELGYRVDF